MTLQNAIDEFLIEQQIRGNSPNTVIYYKRCLGFFASYIGDATRPVEGLSLPDCKGYYLHLKGQEITTTTIQTYIRALRAFLTWCYTEGYLNENIPERFKLPKAQRKTIDVLTDDEVRRLFSCFDLHTFIGCRNYCICALMLDSGLRLLSLIHI